MRSEVVRRGHERLRVGPWRGDDRIAYIAPVGDAIPPTAAMVQHACEILQHRGFERALTGALAERERLGFERVGFQPHEELHLLAHDLQDLPPPGQAPHRRAWPPDRPRALAVDAAAFPPFWRLDRDGLRDAIGATSIARFRVATVGGEVVGYAVTGRSGERGYLQRLAVHPDHAGNGIGRTLVIDGLRWLKRRRARQAVVNTQHGNERALSLYQHLGFRLQPSGLLVLALPL
ncbi:MAG TPA: GNAT family N-acetyltransferase [Acidimicrobiales bacterium]|nr:GNAT family N-acetyltransferase [Acidimicrobiales bacterium]